jgi:hypothetical protein
MSTNNVFLGVSPRDDAICRNPFRNLIEMLLVILDMLDPVHYG